ncbi:hypothetical protein [Streptomyces sp. NBC_01092]|uniref:hypothetical protein n=1 Tax=Streptomyces sp. NBC_01092 TaxID=2903748 RepID=UPI00386D4A67|nr:hypothetical protein OG254_48545 [Streptomyces sp. NBC_01092]
MPDPTLWQRIAKHPLLFHYNRLIALVLALNLAVLANSHDTALAADATLANLTLAVLIRQRHVVNLLFAVARKMPHSWPLWARRSAAKVYHYGGLHVGPAVSAVMWFAVFTGELTAERSRNPVAAPLTVLTLSYVLAALLLVTCVLAIPPVRRRRHNLFERSHRFLGWLSLMLFWLQTVVAEWEEHGRTLDWRDLLSVPQLWVLLVVTASVISPWTRLRKVPVSVSRPSSHVALLRFNFGWAPFPGSVAVISHSPLKEWHAFATFDPPEGNGYRIAVSRAGDWTSKFIDAPPTSVWVKGGATRGMAHVESLFNRVVFVATGSGIGPMLANLMSRPKDRPMSLIWVARSPRQLFGDELVDEILGLVPNAIIVDTKINGKPDVVELTYRVACDFRADGVICVANQKVTWDVVYGLESRGIPTCGPLWDS